MIQYLSAKLAERTELTEVAMRMADQAAAENRDLTETERATIASMSDRCAALDREIETFAAQRESAAAYAALQARVEETNTRGGRGLAVPESAEVASWGRFAESAEFRNYTGRGASGSVTFGSVLDTRAVIMTDTYPGLVPEPSTFVPTQPTTTNPLTALVGKERVSTGSVEWVEIGGDPAAAVVAEGALKPEATFAVTVKTAALETLAHYIAITRQALEDIPRIQSLVEGKLRNGLINKIETDLATVIAAATLPTAEGADLLAAIRVGIGTVQAAGYAPSAVVLNPADYAALDVDVMGATTGGPVIGQRFWGLTPVAAAAQPAGTAIVGDFGNGVTLFDRGVSSVFLTDSHADFFLRNQLVILAETRVKSVVTAPTALVECAATVTP